MKTACRKGSQELTLFTRRNIHYLLMLINAPVSFKQWIWTRYGSQLKNNQLFCLQTEVTATNRIFKL